jgi:hypothetical protein
MIQELQKIRNDLLSGKRKDYQKALVEATEIRNQIRSVPPPVPLKSFGLMRMPEDIRQLVENMRKTEGLFLSVKFMCEEMKN